MDLSAEHGHPVAVALIMSCLAAWGFLRVGIPLLWGLRPWQ